MTRRRPLSVPDGDLSFAIEPLEPRLLLAADWAMGLGPDDARNDPFEIDSLAARRLVDALASAPGTALPASINLDQFLSLQADANSDEGTGKPDRREVRLQSGDAPGATDDDFAVDEDTTLDFNAVWFDPEWTARREITIDNSASTTDLTNFPVLVVLDSSRIDYTLTDDNGDDLRFTDVDGNLLDYEIEVWDESGTSYVWVRIDNISAGSDTESIFMYYGNDNASEGQSPRDVWSVEFAQVQHLDETSGNYDDSTSNNVDIDLVTGGDPHGADTFIGPAHAFDGGNELESQPNALEDSNARGTISMWVQFDERNGQINLLSSNVERDIVLWTDGGSFQASMGVGILDFRDLSGGTIEAGWNQVVFSWDSATGDMWLYVNGLLVDQLSDTPWDPNGINGNDVNIGGDANPAIGVPSLDGLEGGIDELRVANVVRSADWIAAQYATITDTFLSFGSEEAAARGVLANDTDNENDPLRAVLESGPANAAAFTLFADGSFTYTPVADFVGTDSFTYRADDGTSLSAPATVTITVNPVNDAPSFTLAGTQNVVEDGGPFSIAGFSVASAGGGADEAGQVFRYTIITDNPGLFSVPPSIDAAGALTYTLAPDANGTANVEVQMSDSGGVANGGNDTAASAVFAINVAPVNDAPSATLLGDLVVAENAGPQSIAGFATGLPGGGIDEAGQNLVYTVTNFAPGLFSEAPTLLPDGTLTFTFADNAFGVANIEVVLTDSGGTANGGDDTSATYTFTITATPVSVPPTASNMNQMLTYLEDNPIELDNIVVSDGDAGDVITATLTLTDPFAGSLTALSGSGETYVAATGRWRITGTVGEVNTALANVAFVPAADYALDTSIDVTIEDAAGTGPADGAITLQATAVNDAPTATLLGDVTIAEDAGAQTIAGFATALAGGGSDESGQTFSYAVTADQPALFSVAPSIAPDGTLTFTAADNATGTVTVRVRVTDSGDTSNGGQNQSIDYQFDIVITGQPDTPMATNTTQTVTYTEDAGAVGFTPIVVSDNDSGEIITATLTLADPLAGVLTTLSGSGETFDATSGQWRITGTTIEVNRALADVAFVANANVARDTSIVVRIEDAAGTGPADGLITLQAVAINDAPSATLLGDISIAEDAGPQTINNFATAFAGGGSDEAGQTFTYVVTTDTPALFSDLPAISPNGTLSFTTTDNAAGTATVRVRVIDSGDTTNGGQNQSGELVFNIVVAPAPDAPTATNTTQTLTYTEDGDPIRLAGIVVSDNDAGDIITATLTLADAQAGSLSVLAGTGATYDAAAGQWRVTGTTNEVNAALADVAFLQGTDYARDTSIVVTIEDSSGAGPADGLITLNAIAINDAPSAILPATITVAEDAGPQTIAGFATAFAGGGSDETAQTFRYEVISDSPALFSAAPLIAPDGTLTFTAADDANGVAMVRVRVIDSGDTTNGGENTSSEYVVRIIVEAQPDTPIATNVVQTINYTEDGGPVGFANILVTDADTDDIITATLALADPASGTLSTTSGSGETFTAANGQWQVRGTTTEVNAALAQVAFNPTADYAQDTSITVRIADAAGNRATDGVLTLQATSVNDAPTATALNQLQRFVEDAITIALDDISVADADIGEVVSATLTLGDTSAGALSSTSGQGESYNPASGIWRVSGSAAQVSAALAAVTFQPAADFAGEVSIVTRITDQAGAGPSAGEIRLEAIAVNDAPVIAVAGNVNAVEDAPVQRVTGFATVVDNGGNDERDQSIVFEVSTDNPSLFVVPPSINSAGDLVYEVAPDANGAASVTVVARDNGGRDNGGEDTAAAVTFNLQIDPVNDAPQASNRFVIAPPSGIVVLSTSTFGFADPTDGDGFEGIFIVSLPAQGELLLDGRPLAAGDFVSSEDIDANRLSLSAMATPGDSLLLNFDFLVRDTGGVDDGGTNVADKASTITIAVDVPAANTLSTQQVEDEADAQPASASTTSLSPEEILAAEPTLPAVELAFIEDQSAPPLLPVALPAFENTAMADSETALAPVRDTSAASPAVTRVVVALLDNIRSIAADATVIDTSATTPLAAATEGLVEQLTDLRDDALTEQASEELVIMQSSAVAFGLSVGYVSWLLRGGVLLSSMLTSLPAWRFIDPLPIFSGIRQRNEDDESLQDIVSTQDDSSVDTTAEMHR